MSTYFGYLAKIYFGTLPLIRTGRTSPFERDDFTNLSSRALVPAEGIEPYSPVYIVVPSGGFEPPTLPNLGTCAGYKPGVLPLNYKGKFFTFFYGC